MPHGLDHNAFKIWCNREFPAPESFTVGETKLHALPSEFSGWVALKRAHALVRAQKEL